MSYVIFLLGAGASMDAGMPSVADLTKELRKRLPELRPEFAELFDALAARDPEVNENYERFFEWIVLLYRCQKEPFNRAVCLNLNARLREAVPPLMLNIRRLIFEILRSRHQVQTYRPDYLARLGEFVPDRSRLRVFTTNYDLCVEDACRAKGISVTTGFKKTTQTTIGRWNPSVFHDGTGGINFYKLHGSLNWIPDSGQQSERPQRLAEYYPPEWDGVPDLVLGPGPKLHHDEPYVTLYSEFHQALREAEVCVAIGCGFGDEHIKEPLGVAWNRGMRVIDVNPSCILSGYFLGKGSYERIRIEARKALESDVLLQKVCRALKKQA